MLNLANRRSFVVAISSGQSARDNGSATAYAQSSLGYCQAKRKQLF